MRMRRKRRKRIAVAVFLLGLAVFLFPIAYGAMTDQAISQEANSFLEAMGFAPPAAQESQPLETIPEETEPTIPYEELLEAMEQYNATIWEERQSGLTDPWSYEQPSFDLREYGIENEVFGVIRIPRLELSMPIYLGATEQHMADGAAHLSQTSIPIAGENVNCVLAGHRGYNGASYFRYIPDLQVGDEVIVTNLWGELRYKVVGAKIIAPNDIQEILIQEGRELLTLLTCHPYASNGRQRYVVYCERI